MLKWEVCFAKTEKAKTVIERYATKEGAEKAKEDIKKTYPKAIVWIQENVGKVWES